MMRLPSATSVSIWQTSRAVRGEVVFKMFIYRCTFIASGFLSRARAIFRLLSPTFVLAILKEWALQKTWSASLRIIRAVVGFRT
ncbi:hypothetical protein D3C85_466780 [compost metagenome]